MARTTTFTILYSVVSIGSLCGALLTARRKTIEVRDVVNGAALFGVAMLVFSASPGLLASVPFAIFVGFSSIIFMTASTAIVQMRSAPEMRGRVLALQAIVFLGSTPIGGPFIGWICDQFGARAGFVVGGAAALGAAGWGFVVDGRHQRVGRGRTARRGGDLPRDAARPLRGRRCAVGLRRRSLRPWPTRSNG